MSEPPGKKKYGLYIPPKPKPAAPKPAAASLFGDDDDDDGAYEKAVLGVDVRQRQTERMQQAALKLDPSIFQYDEAFSDDEEDTRPSVKRSKGPTMPPAMAQAKPREAPKYMSTLLQHAAERKAQSDITRVRLLQKEAALDAESHADKEVIITSAYKKRLEAMKEQMEAEEEARRDEEQVARGRQDMSGFYRNLMTRNESFGAGRLVAERVKPVEREPVKRYGQTKESHPSDEEEEFGPVRRK